MAYASIRVHGYGSGVSLLFFGFCCILLGYLINKSGYLPVFIGALLALGGFGYVVFSVSQMLRGIGALPLAGREGTQRCEVGGRVGEWNDGGLSR